MIEVKRYREEDFDRWNYFNSNSKNHLFMFDRRYMDYHKDRFNDHSLFFLQDGEIVALLPMNEDGNTLISHGGLTYGGFITDNAMKQVKMLDCFDELIKYARENGFGRIIYKCIPHIYYNQSAEEDRYALFVNGARLKSVDVSTYVNLHSPIKMPKGRKAQISRARREGVSVSVKTDFESYRSFLTIENEVLKTRHNTKAVHTAEELMLLHNLLPDNIHLYVAEKDGCMIAGVVIYEYEEVIHTQYMAAQEEGRTLGALDLIVATLMDRYKDKKKWLDFGISTEHGKIYLNEGLCAQKEGFGGRTGIYEIWEMSLT